ncbi:MAG: putative lipid II flippase FtsW, partial [Patescibacteria group bacterium]|nr:putative lipid II flippase FtsW [Patescibacteria group bacterium]
RRFHTPDPYLIIATLFLVVFGLIMVSSASVVESYQATGSNTYYFFRQAIFAVVGLAVWFFIQRIDYHKYRMIASGALLISLILLILVFVPGIGIDLGGSRRWLGAGDLTLQASEVMKLGLILYLAYWFERKGIKVTSFYNTFLPLLFLIGLICGLVIIEPDLGTTLVLAGIALSMYFSAGGALQHIFTLFVLAIGSAWGLIWSAPYRASRLLTFLDPSRDPLGSGYHINQALIALGSGGLAGAGFGHSRQKFNFLPEASSDSIFAIIGEELGFIGVSLFVLLPLAIFVWRGIITAKRAPDSFGRLLAIGITTWVGWQAVMNIGAIIGLIPLTGVPLPFISQGGTSLVLILISSGILLNISRQTIYTKDDEDPFSWWGNIWARFAGSVRRSGNSRTKAED